MDISLIWASLLVMGDSILRRMPYVVIGLIVYLIIALLGRLAGHIIRAAGSRTRLDDTLANLLGGLVGVGFHILGLLIAAVIVFPTFQPGDLLAGLGITSVAIGFAFKDILQNWLGAVDVLCRG